MADIVLFHHALGLTTGCRAIADALTGAGHTVHAPDMYDGAVFDSLDDGIEHLERIGFDEVIQRGCAAVDGLPDRLVCIGISIGAMPAQRLGQTRPGAAGAVLLEACAPVDAFASGWPDGVAVQIHGMDNDEFFAGEGDLDNARTLIEQAASTASAELFTYPGDAHLFVDSSTAGYDHQAFTLVLDRIADFLRRLDRHAEAVS